MDIVVVGLDVCSQVSDGSWGKNVINFGVDNSSTVHVDKGPTARIR